MTEIESICFITHGLHNFIFPSISETAGGAERQQYLLAKELSDRGYNISAIVGNIKDNLGEESEEITVIEGCPHGANSIVDRGRKALRILKLLKEADADVYYVRGHHFHSIVTAIFCSLDQRKYVYCVANDSDIDPSYLERYNPLVRFLYIQSMKVADTLVSQTKSQQSMMRAEYGLESTVIPNGYTLPDETKILSHEKREFVLWVGEIEPEKKRPDRFLNIASSLSEVKFVLVGPPGNDDTYVRKIKERAHKMENVSYDGFVAPDKIDWYFNRAIALVNTSDYEGFPNTFLEAWRYRTPVVSLFHDLDGIITQANIGILSGSHDQLVADVERFAQDTELRKEIGTRGREYLSENYRLDRIIDKYETIFNSANRTESET